MKSYLPAEAPLFRCDTLRCQPGGNVSSSINGLRLGSASWRLVRAAEFTPPPIAGRGEPRGSGDAAVVVEAVVPPLEIAEVVVVILDGAETVLVNPALFATICPL